MFKKSPSKINFLKSLVPLALASTVAVGSSTSAQALQFNFSYAPGTTLEQMVGFEMAGGMWTNNLGDDIGVNIHVEMSNSFSGKTIGGSLPGIVAQQRFENYRKNMERDIRSFNDTLAVNSLGIKKDGKKFNAMVDGKQIKDIDNVSLTRANAKAMGLVADSSNDHLDGFVTISNLQNQSVGWDYNYLHNDKIANNNLDFLSVVVHELGHSLGFVSGVDNPGWLNLVEQNQNGNKIDRNEVDYVTPLDLFRYTSESAAYGKELGEGIPDLSFGKNPYFSITRGITGMADFSTGTATNLGGDGKQASHWKSQNGAIGIMDALLSPGQRRNLSELDLAVMDVIGWNLQKGNKNLATLHLEAKQRLANKLGVTVAWLDANPIEAAKRLSRDRSQDVDMMVDKSLVYEWGRQTCQSKITGCWRQDGYWQRMLWQEYSPQSSTQDVKEVPEPASTMGLLGMVAVFVGSRLKKSAKASRKS
jgi:hypothetical protein